MTFVDGVGVDKAVTFVDGALDVYAAADFVVHVGSASAAVYFVNGFSDAYDAADFVSRAGVFEAFNFMNDVATIAINDGIKVAEKNQAGFDLANKDLTGKNLSGLKITSLEGCGYDQSDPPNFSRCDLTGCNMTNLISVTKRWEDLVEGTLQNAEQTINDEPTFTVTKVEEGSVVTEDFLLNRVRVWYRAEGTVSRVPVVG